MKEKKLKYLLRFIRTFGKENTVITRTIQNRLERNEAKVLESIGEVKNTAKRMVRLSESGEKVTVIPDAITDTKVIEIKDVKSLSNTKQTRGERKAAQDLGKDFTIITGEKTHVSGKIPDGEIVRRSDIGPQ